MYEKEDLIQSKDGLRTGVVKSKVADSFYIIRWNDMDMDSVCSDAEFEFYQNVPVVVEQTEQKPVEQVTTDIKINKKKSK